MFARGGLYVCARRLDIENLLRPILIYSVSYFILGALGLCLEGRSPPKHPRGDGPELPISEEARHNAHIASACVKLH